MLRFLLCFWVVVLSAQQSAEQVFTEIYQKGEWSWGVPWSSGGGAQIENSKKYIEYLKKFLKDKKIRSVVDLGCGDWEIAKHIDWDSIDYVGIDVVKHLIDVNEEKYGTPTVRFMQLDAIEEEMPEADLLICKDVLQHLPHEHIKKLIKQLHKYKHCLITNDVDPATMTCENLDVHLGGFRGIDIRKPPFNLPARAVMAYKSDYAMKQVLYLKCGD